ncbi:MAG: PrgI family protein [Bacteroidales bacterium]|nr:PrgI family protein [Bacteroidales bacterium]
MEVRINKEIREYSENVYFGLTLRQFFFSALGCIAAIGIYFLCKDFLGLEITTWLCVLGVVPFAALGFITYNGMTAEQFAAAWLRSKWINPSRYVNEPVSFYYEIMKTAIEADEKGGK